jgi:hypothetical protein
MQEREVITKMTKTEALAVARVADIGIRIARELGLIQSLDAAERGARKLVNAHDVDERRPPAGIGRPRPPERVPRKPA